MHTLAKVLVLALSLSLAACGTVRKVSDLDAKTGLLPTEHKARVVVNKPIDMDAYRGLLLVPNGDFMKPQIEKIGYFGEVLNVEDLKVKIIQANLTDKVPTIQDRIGISNAAKHYKPFLWLRFETQGYGSGTKGRYVLTDPLTAQDYFVAETDLDFVWSGVNDQKNWYPMFNAFIEYIRANSKTFK